MHCSYEHRKWYDMKLKKKRIGNKERNKCIAHMSIENDMIWNCINEVVWCISHQLRKILYEHSKWIWYGIA